jgi:hypothetical protein
VQLPDGKPEWAKQPDSDNWLHFQCIVTQRFEEERAEVDTRMDTGLARMPEFFQNVAKVTPTAPNDPS